MKVDIEAKPVNGYWKKILGHRDKVWIHTCPRCGWEGKGFHHPRNCVPPVLEEKS